MSYIPECGPGWYPIVDTFLELVERDHELNKETPVAIHQIKEKFGELRIYYSGGSKYTDGYAAFAQSMSGRVCEECGAPSSVRSLNGWYTTKCEEHIV